MEIIKDVWVLNEEIRLGFKSKKEIRRKVIIGIVFYYL